MKRVSAFLVGVGPPTMAGASMQPQTATEYLTFVGPDRILQVSIENREQAAVEQTPSDDGSRCFLLGDDQEWWDDSRESHFANAATVCVHARSKAVEVRSSISGLPPVFVYRDRDWTVVASTIHLIAMHPGVRLEFDPAGVAELGTIGFPVGHRTLYRGLSVVPAGSTLRLTNEAGLEFLDPWSRPDQPAFTDWRDYINEQVRAFRESVRRMDTERSFLSLTAGLDTRAIFAEMIHEGRRIPAYTITGPSASLDVLRAEELCHAYGIPHQRVSIDQEFFDSVSETARDASRRSGGLASLGQATEVYFCRSVMSGFGGRVSGNLGNQVGRSGTEGIGTRGATLAALSRDFRREGQTQHSGHWFKSLTSVSGELGPLALIQEENLFASLGNYAIGSSFLVQQTPYADRTLIQYKCREPVDRRRAPMRGTLGLRLLDLRHRFLGEPRKRSFQREAIAQRGGAAANLAINWGWRAPGGVSLKGVVIGLRALTDMIMASKIPWPSFGGFYSKTSLSGFSGFQAVPITDHTRVKQLVYDTLGSASHRKNGVLDTIAIDDALKTGMSDKASRATLLFAFDLAMAEDCFVTGARRQVVERPLTNEI